jgi:hypothetical protein
MHGIQRAHALWSFYIVWASMPCIFLGHATVCACVIADEHIQMQVYMYFVDAQLAKGFIEEMS